MAGVVLGGGNSSYCSASVVESLGDSYALCAIVSSSEKPSNTSLGYPRALGEKDHVIFSLNTGTSPLIISKYEGSEEASEEASFISQDPL